MLFNSILFVEFLFIVFLIHTFLKSYQAQNYLLLIASFIFYAFWDYRFILLLLIVIIANFVYGNYMFEERSQKKKKSALILCIIFNLIILGFFKYFGFFYTSLAPNLQSISMNIIIPLGISFYILQAMSYPLDAYRGDISKISRLTNFALFVSFFPTITSGPIERSKNLVPQILKKRIVTAAHIHEGAWLLAWGLFKKIMIADNIARSTLAIFDSSKMSAGTVDLWIGFYLFAFQIYADFSGYSDMARGIARLFGIEITRNFENPYLSKNLTDFWTRWHVSLTNWVKDYVYYPLALSLQGNRVRIFACFLLTWVLIGLWHGPQIKYFIWGIYHAILLMIYHLIRPRLTFFESPGLLNKGWGVFCGLATFHLFALGLFFFSCGTAEQALAFIARLFIYVETYSVINYTLLIWYGCLILFLMLIETFQTVFNDEFVVFRIPIWGRVLLFYVMFYITVYCGAFSGQRHFYFQF